MVLAPLMAFMPSKLVKRQMEFRERAIALGLQVKVADLPQSSRAKVRKQDVEQGVVYRLPFRQRQSLAAIAQQSCVTTEQGFEWSALQEDFVKPMFERCWSQLPEDVVALELNASGVAVYWREQGTIERVQQLYDVLSGLRAQVLEFYGVNNGNT
jgi:hypothetical protein